nr:hypothetical protein [Herbaspirillum sp. B39]
MYLVTPHFTKQPSAVPQHWLFAINIWQIDGTRCASSLPAENPRSIAFAAASSLYNAQPNRVESLHFPSLSAALNYRIYAKSAQTDRNQNFHCSCHFGNPA